MFNGVCPIYWPICCGTHSIFGLGSWIWGDLSWRIKGNWRQRIQSKPNSYPGWSLGSISRDEYALEVSENITMDARLWYNYTGSNLLIHIRIPQTLVYVLIMSMWHIRKDMVYWSGWRGVEIYRGPFLSLIMCFSLFSASEIYLKPFPCTSHCLKWKWIDIFPSSSYNLPCKKSEFNCSAKPFKPIS